MNQTITKNIIFIKIILFIVCLYPAVNIIYRIFTNHLGANPIEYIIRYTGDKAILFLTLTLAITPIRKLLTLSSLIKFRRFLGLFSFFYLFIHVNFWLLDNNYDINEVSKSISKTYIIIGIFSFFILLFMTITSFSFIIKKIAKIHKKLWQRIHQGIYLASLLAVFHYYLIKASKNNLQEVYLYSLIISFLLLYRAYIFFKNDA